MLLESSSDYFLIALFIYSMTMLQSNLLMNFNGISHWLIRYEAL